MSDVDDSSERLRARREALLGQCIGGRYVVRALIGHGGMGAVYEAEHVGLGKRVAIKFIDPEYATDERVVARFAREARAMSAIESAHIVTVLDAGADGGRPYLVMERLCGEDLGQRLRRTRRVSLRDALHVVAQVLKGLAKAHAAGVVHRDLKPDNVFLVRSDADPLFAKIVDFGISKIERPRDRTTPLALTGRGTVLGTPFYMAPEQAQARPDVDGRADVYSVGAILFECLTGRPPHTGETYEQTILSICMNDAPDVRAIEPKMPGPVAELVARALARDRGQRFASAERMLAAVYEVAPAERARVPLEGAAAETMLSAGMATPLHGHGHGPRAGAGAGLGLGSDPMFAQTRIAGSGASAGSGSGSGPTIIEVGPRAFADGAAGHDGASRIVAGNGAIVDGAAAARARSAPGAGVAPTLLEGVGPPLVMGRAAIASSAPSSRAPTSASASASASGAKRSMGIVFATALVAMVLGVGIMLGILELVDARSATSEARGSKGHATSAHASAGTAANVEPASSANAEPASAATTNASSAPELTSGTASDAVDARSGSVGGAASSTSSSSSAQAPDLGVPAAATGRVKRSVPSSRSSGSATKPSTKSLDLARDLP